jgi:hypothetical protein
VSGTALAGPRAGRGQQGPHAGAATADLTAASPELGNDPLLTAAGRGHLMTGHDNKAMPAQTAAANSPVFREGALPIRRG